MKRRRITTIAILILFIFAAFGSAKTGSILGDLLYITVEAKEERFSDRVVSHIIKADTYDDVVKQAADYCTDIVLDPAKILEKSYIEIIGFEYSDAEFDISVRRGYDIPYHLTEEITEKINQNLYHREEKKLPFDADYFDEISVFSTDDYHFTSYENGILKGYFTFYAEMPYPSWQGNEIRKTADDILQSLHLEGLNEGQKYLKIYQWVINNIVYQNGSSNYNNKAYSSFSDAYNGADSLYNALINKRAICEGYARAYAMLCHKAGLEVRYETGETTLGSGKYHAWNLIKLGESWYYCDPTYDEMSDELNYFLIGYDYFYAGHEGGYLHQELSVSKKDFEDYGRYFTRDQYTSGYNPGLEKDNVLMLFGNECHGDHLYEKDVEEKAGCEVNGYRKDICKRCGYWVMHGSKTSCKVADKTGHNFVSEYRKGDCSNSSGTYFYCTNTGCTEHWYLKNETYQEATHNYPKDTNGNIEWTIETEPTCEFTGEKYAVCKDCGYRYEAGIENLSAHRSHEYQSQVIKKANCKEDGIIRYTCRNCGDIYEETYEDKSMQALGHQWNQGVITKQPSSFENGIKTFTCIVCGETKTELIDRIPSNEESSTEEKTPDIPSVPSTEPSTEKPALSEC